MKHSSLAVVDVALVVVGLAFIVGIASSPAADVPKKADPTVLYSTSSALLYIDTMPNMSIRCGEGYVVISMSKGTVTFNNCTPDAATKAFWNGVQTMMPEWKESIIAGYKIAQKEREAKLTVMWGEDFKKTHPDEFKNVTHFYLTMIGMQQGPSYEFGLRSDGVVIWREIKEDKP